MDWRKANGAKDDKKDKREEAFTREKDNKQVQPGGEEDLWIVFDEKNAGLEDQPNDAKSDACEKRANQKAGRAKRFIRDPRGAFIRSQAGHYRHCINGYRFAHVVEFYLVDSQRAHWRLGDDAE